MFKTADSAQPGEPGFAVRATAHPNIALVKYWGKRDIALNLPAVSSLSVTLDTLQSTTEIEILPHTGPDEVMLNGAVAEAQQADKVSRFVDRIRTAASHAKGTKRSYAISLRATNNFPTGAGLASSASGFAALAQAVMSAFGRATEPDAVSRLARLGSGSAARSVYGGFVSLAKGSAADGSDTLTVPLAAATHWPLKIVVAIIDRGAKSIGSTQGMEHTRKTSPFYAPWLTHQEADMAEAKAAVLTRDFPRLAQVTRHSAMKMHAVMLAANPPLIYWHAGTLAALRCVEDLAHQGVDVAPTMDAGPQLKALCTAQTAQQVAQALRQTPGVLDVVEVGLGGGVTSEVLSFRKRTS